MPATIHVVDDDASFRKSIAQLLQVSGYSVALYESAEALLRTPPQPRLGCVLLDIRMPGLSGPELQDRFAQLDLPLPIIFLTGYGTISTSVRAIKAGAEDFLTKPIAKDDLLNAVDRAVERSRVLLAKRERADDLQKHVGMLTPQEHKVFVLVAQGQINKQIAFKLGITERTIKAHRRKVMLKLNAQSLVELVEIAKELGILDVRDDDRGEDGNATA